MGEKMYWCETFTMISSLLSPLFYSFFFFSGISLPQRVRLSNLDTQRNGGCRIAGSGARAYPFCCTWDQR
jgi:hypothetical protein